MSKRDAAFLPKCNTKGCNTHAPIVEHKLGGSLPYNDINRQTKCLDYSTGTRYMCGVLRQTVTLRHLNNGWRTSQ